MNNFRSYYLLAIVLIAFGTVQTRAQDLSAFTKEKPVRVSGSFNANANYLQSNSYVTDPLGYHASLQLNFSFYNLFTIPLNFSYGSYGSGFNTISINRFGISPAYKSLRVHGGYRSFALSPYLMNGVTILGGGIEWSPKKFHLLVFHGNMADRYNLGGEFIQFKDEKIEFYKRRTSGIKIGIGKPSNRFSVMMFHAEDNPQSGTMDTLLKYNIKPKENVVFGSDLNFQFFKIISLQANAAASVLTNDVNGKPIDANEEEAKWIDRASILTAINTTSRYAFAYDAQLSIRIKTIQLGLKYQHVDPYYSSLGLAFLQSNYDNYLATLHGSLFRNKLIVFSNFGLQYTNVNGFTGLPQKRLVQTTNVNWNISKSLTYTLNYTNMNQNTNVSVEEVNDSLQLTTNAQGWNTGLMFRLGKIDLKPHQFNISYSHNTFDVIHYDETTSGNTTRNGLFGYRYNLKDKWSLGTSLNYNDFTLPDRKAGTRYGLILNYSKFFNQKLSLRIQSGYRFNLTDQVRDGYVLNGSFHLTWKPAKKHQFNFSLNAFSRQTKIQAPKNEFSYRIGYFTNF